MMFISTKHISHLGTVVIENTQYELRTFVKSRKLTSVMITHHQSEKFWFSNAAKWRSKCHPSFPLAIVSLSYSRQNKILFCFVFEMLKRKKKSNWARYYQRQGSVPQKQKGVRGIKVPEHPILHFFVQGKERKEQVFLPVN